MIPAILATILSFNPAFAESVTFPDAMGDSDNWQSAQTPTPLTSTSPTRTDHAGPSIGLGLSTLGATVEAGYRFNDDFGLRGVIGDGDTEYTEMSDGETYTGTLETDGFGLLADYYPFAGGMRVSGGLFQTDYKGSLFANDVDFGGGATSDMTAIISQKDKVAPVFTVGYQGKINRNFHVSADAGAIFGTGFEVSATESSGTVTQADIDSEISELRDVAGDLKVIPFVKVMIGMTF